jgi:WD40 repeat protein/energy-coupling factor transporter ATP-binding protein EcfA2
VNTSEFQLNLAVVIGINDYHNGIPALGTAKQDAEAIAEILARDYHYQVHLITDHQATSQHLQQWLETDLPATLNRLTPSRLLFYFAGHGIALNGDDGPQGYLIPQDAKLGDVATYLRMQQVEAALTQLSCRHCLVILDCCFAGAFRWSSTRKFVSLTETIHKERYDRFIHDPAWQVITSAASDQYALDNLDLNSDRGIANDNTQHSPFAAALMAALGGAADASPPASNGKMAGDGVITAFELYLYLRDAVEIPTDANHQRQTPQIWCLKKHDKGEFIFLPPGHQLNLPPAPALDELADNNPYRGLKSYESVDSALFFGRTALIKQLCEAMSDRSFTVVLGASGSGKSSLVKAGLIPHLDHSTQSPQLDNSRLKPQAHPHQCQYLAWKILPPIRPGESPLNSLNSAVKELLPSETARIDAKTVAEAIAVWSRANPETKLLLVIDQFEELITLCRTDLERQQFLDLLTDLLQAHPDRLRLVVTLRSDFEPQFRTTPLESQWQAARFVVPAMTRAELRDVIEEPAFAKVVYFESMDDRGDLVDRLIDEVAGMPGALPLLSFALSELYLKLARRYLAAQNRGDTVDRAITWADYDELGGVTKSLTRRADREYAALVAADPAYARTIRHVMLRMVAVGGELARRQVPESELKYPEPENTRVQTTIERFLAARLLVGGTDLDDRPYIEPAHDALIRGWEKILLWKQADRENLSLQRRLTAAAVEWQQVQDRDREQPQGVLNRVASVWNWLDRELLTVEDFVTKILAQLKRQLQRSPDRLDRSLPNQFLWNTNPYLNVLTAQLKSPDNGFNQVEAEFVRSSVLQKRRNRSWRWRLAILVVSGLTGLTAIALFNLRTAQIGQATAARASAETQLRLNQSLDGLIDSLRAGKSLKHGLLQLFAPEAEIQEQVKGTLQTAVYTVRERDRLAAYQSTVRSSFSPNGQLIATAGGNEDLVIIWNLRDRQLTKWTTNQRRVNNISFSPDGKLLATAGEDGTVQLWNLTGQPQAKWQAEPQGRVRTVSFSPNGKLIATAGQDGTIQLWDLQGNQIGQPFRGHRGGVWSVAFDPQDDDRLASVGDDGDVYLWNLQGQVVKKWRSGAGKELSSIKFSPNGQLVAAAGKDSIVRLWNMQGQQLAEMKGHQGRVWNLAFSSDGQTIASGAGDGTVRVWNLQGKLLTKLTGHQGPVRSVSFSHDGKLNSGGDDGTVRLWDLQEKAFAQLKGHQAQVRTVTYSRDGQNLATSSDDGTIRLWNAQGRSLGQWNAQGLPLSQLKGKPDPVRDVNFSPDGQRLVSAVDGIVRLWTRQGQLLKEFNGQQRSIRSIEFSPDGQRLASGGDDGTIHLWNLQGQSLAAWKADPKRIWYLAFSPVGVSLPSGIGQRLASGGDDGIVRLWDLQGQSRGQLEGHLGPVFSVAFSPDGQQLVSGGQDGTIRLWDLRNNLQKNLFQVLQSEVNSVAFSPDSQMIVSGDNRGNIQLWGLQIQQQFAAWTAHQNSIVRKVTFSPVRGASPQENGQMLATAADDGTAKLWQLESFDELLDRACKQGAHEYLNNNTRIEESDRHLCDRVSSTK